MGLVAPRSELSILAVVRAVIVGSICAGAVLGCGSGSGRTQSTADSDAHSDCTLRAPEPLVPVVDRTVPHDTDSYTQGLVMHAGVVYESAGRYGRSRIRAIDPMDGSELGGADLPDDVFGEGLAVGNEGELVQLTWKEGTAYRWRPEAVTGGGSPTGSFTYEGEGWGLTAIGDGTLAMSDGSDRIVMRDPVTFGVTDEHRVSRSDGPADALNELEWDGRYLWANRYQSAEILRIDIGCWNVTGVADASMLVDDARERAAAAGVEIDVLNGIAAPDGHAGYVVTGKLWPVMYFVHFARRQP